eukprot:6247118-Prymnesium_polylepis.2
MTSSGDESLIGEHFAVAKGEALQGLFRVRATLGHACRIRKRGMCAILGQGSTGPFRVRSNPNAQPPVP